jgi:hypothetical protein
MGDEFYCILKLVSGEEVFSLICVDDEEESNPIIVLQNPVIIHLMQVNGNSYLKIKNWIDLSEEDTFFITLDKVITMTESTDQKLIKMYNAYNNQDTEESDLGMPGEVKLSDNMGYISSVDEARKKLEDIFKNDIDT